MSVIEDIPLAVDLYYASVIVGTAVRWHICGLVGVDMQIGVADQHSAVSESSQRAVAYSVAELVVLLGGIDEIILLPEEPRALLRCKRLSRQGLRFPRDYRFQR